MGVDPKSCSLFHVPFPLTERLRAQGEKEHSHWWNGSLLHMLVQSNSFDHNYSINWRAWASYGAKPCSVLHGV